jgi:hypothetical protein
MDLPQTSPDHTLPADAPSTPPAETYAGTLHLFVAFDWGDAVDLARVRELARAERRALPRRRRTPASIEYRPRPLVLRLEPVCVELPEIGPVSAPAEATVFDFAAVSVALHIPFQLSADALARLAASLADPEALVEAARKTARPLYEKLLPAIEDPEWSALTEEYFVFQAPVLEPLPSTDHVADARTAWLANLVRLEAGPLSAEEIAEALRLHLSYRPTDLFVADWPAAVLLDGDCEETLQIIEFANLQLLEYRHIDDRLDDNLTTATGLIRGGGRSWLPFWRRHGRALRALGELKVEANGLFERTGNVLKLVGDQYLARVYRLLAARFHLEAREESIQRKLEVLEGIYTVLSDQSEANRGEFLELTVIFLIVLEVLVAIFH